MRGPRTYQIDLRADPRSAPRARRSAAGAGRRVRAADRHEQVLAARDVSRATHPRLSRCLASRRRTRIPIPFTGFDEFDNLRMKDLWPGVAPADDRTAAAGSPAAAAARDQRRRSISWAAATSRGRSAKAESFTVTSLHAGSPFTGYRRTSPRTPRASGIVRSVQARGGRRGAARRRPRLYGDDRGLSLGTAMTISGAAANPEHGLPLVAGGDLPPYAVQRAARAGGWATPGRRDARRSTAAAPRLTARLIVRELFGLTNDRAQLRAALRRRALRQSRIVRDGAAPLPVHRGRGQLGDPGCGFDDLGNAIRKIRIDLGVPIDFEGPMHIHCARHDARAGRRRTLLGGGEHPLLVRGRAARHAAGCARRGLRRNADLREAHLLRRRAARRLHLRERSRGLPARGDDPISSTPNRSSRATARWART